MVLLTFQAEHSMMVFFTIQAFSTFITVVVYCSYWSFSLIDYHVSSRKYFPVVFIVHAIININSPSTFNCSC